MRHCLCLLCLCRLRQKGGQLSAHVRVLRVVRVHGDDDLAAGGDEALQPDGQHAAVLVALGHQVDGLGHLALAAQLEQALGHALVPRQALPRAACGAGAGLGEDV